MINANLSTWLILGFEVFAVCFHFMSNGFTPFIFSVISLHCCDVLYVKMLEAGIGVSNYRNRGECV